MKNVSALISASLLFLLNSCTTTPQGPKPAIAPDKSLEEKVEATLKKMTLEEKIGQMTQLTLDVITVGKGPFHTELPVRLDKALLDTVFGKYKIGSILNVPASTPQTVTEWSEIIKELQEASLAATGIPIVYGVDQIHGTTYTIDGTLFPQEIALGATFNPQLVYEGAKISAYETKAGNIPWNFSPVLDMGRDPRWPRMWETYGEDTYLVSTMGKACIEGYQGTNPNAIGKDQVAACLKHYMGYGVPYSGKDRTPSYISAMDMRERHFQPFVEAIGAGALSVMVNSAMNNGLPVHASHELLTVWLKEDLNWDGVIVTDWADINNLYQRDKIAKDAKEAIKISINAGVDMSMVPYEWTFCNYLKELVQEGEVSMARIDDATRRILRMKYRLNLFDRPYWSPSEYPDFGSEAHAQVALKAAEEAVTLLKNEEGLLPLSLGKKILVTGPNANAMRCLNGGWSLSWQGDKADEFGERYHTILEAISATWGSSNITYEPGVTYAQGAYWAENEAEIEKAVQAARNVDYILLCIGENSYCETPGNLVDLTLSEQQRNLAKALAKTGKPIIMVLNEGRPRIIADIEPVAKAVVHVYLPGNYGADALANILSGAVNPSGKLPFTYPKSVNSLITYDHKPSENMDTMEGAYNYNAVTSVQWAFGYGLSYTDFKYSNLKVNKDKFTVADELVFTVDVTNTGDKAGKESVLLFISDKVASLTPDVRRLRAFNKVELKPGETKTVQLKVKAQDLAFVGNDTKWILEAGDFAVQTGDQTLALECTQTHVWNTPNR